MKYSDYITDDERLSAIRLGFMSKLASEGITPERFEKMAAGHDGAAELFKNIIGLSIGLGVPIGGVWYLIDRNIRKDDKKTRKLTKVRDYYRDVISEIKNKINPIDENELAATNPESNEQPAVL